MRARSLPSARATRVASRATASRAPPSLSLSRAPRARSGRFRRHPPSRPPRALPDADVAPVEAWQLWFGFIAGVGPFAIAAYEFGKRVLIQRRCALCAGSGLVEVERSRGARLVKCTACGGFLPWQSWERFLSSEAGNGGVVRAPKGQTSAFYSVEKATAASREMAARRARDGEASSDRDGDDDAGLG